LRYVKLLVYNKKLAVVTYILVVLSVVLCFRVISTGFIPTDDEAVLIAQINLPAGASMSRTAEFCKHVQEATSHIDGINVTISMIGTGASNTALMVYRLKPWDERDFSGFGGMIKKIIRKAQGKPTDLSPQAITARIKAAIAPYREGQAYIMMPPPIPGMSMTAGFEMQLLSKGSYTPQDLSQLATKLIIAANQDKDLSSVFTTYQANMLQYVVHIDTEKALALGVDLKELYATLGSNLGTYYVNDFNMLGRVFRVQLRADEPFRRNANDIQNIYVKNNRGEMVPITTLIELEPTIGAAAITRYNQYRSVTLVGGPAKGKSTGDAMNAMERVFKKNMPQNVGYEWSGTSAQEREASGQTLVVIAMALIFVYLFLVALYESWTIPVSVMLIAPVAALGALLFQLMMGAPFDLYSQVGMIMLIGMSVKQAILIVEFAKELHERDGYTIEEAAMEAARLRLRAIFMTAVAFILGMVPLVMAHGAGAISRKSIGNTVFGGMIATCFLGTLLTPAFYVLVQSTVNKVMKKDNNEHKI